MGRQIHSTKGKPGGGGGAGAAGECGGGEGIKLEFPVLTGSDVKRKTTRFFVVPLQGNVKRSKDTKEKFHA